LFTAGTSIEYRSAKMLQKLQERFLTNVLVTTGLLEIEVYVTFRGSKFEQPQVCFELLLK
jgi:hypothetical protein